MSTHHEAATPPPTALDPGRLPVPALIGLFVSGFIGILTEALPAGLLPAMSHTLHQSISVTGQTVTVYAVGTAAFVIPLSVATTHWRRRDLLVVALLGQIVTNAITALSHDFMLTMVARFVAGLSSAVIWSLLGSYAARIAPEGKQGRAISIALGGIPVSLALGIPAGVAIGSVASWQVAFWCSVGLTALTIAWVLATLPNLPGLARTERHTALEVLNLPGIKTILLVVGCFVVAHNILYTYIADFLDDAGLGDQTGWILFVFGAMAIASILLVGAQIDRHLRKLVVGSAFVFAFAVLVLATLSGVAVLVYLAAAAWGLAFGSSATLFTTAVVARSGPAAEVANTLMISIFSGSIAAGGLIGGVLVDAFGSHTLAWVCLALVAVSAVVSYTAKRTAFPLDQGSQAHG
ncbi:MFS transporter [Nocardioides sp. BP30]|uniref:MFS transporter n=1 Tax=Nocardioides sp. BP30 TaxID=3036374 RepID=UPI0024695922|nr:MFS transporter [Nocardioides sp. BP30]WGL52462.1 MFS transporter [Nocardioides sp. BP30]